MADELSQAWSSRYETCPWCRRESRMKLVHYGRREYNFSAWEDTRTGNHGGMYFLAQCQRCWNPSLFKQALCSGPDEFPDAVLEWPRWEFLADGVSEGVQAIYGRAFL